MNHIIYHRSDLDGQCSGAIARYALEKRGMEYKMISLEYGESLNLDIFQPDDNVFLLDITLKPIELHFEIAKRINPDKIYRPGIRRLSIIDHHESFYKDPETYQLYINGHIKGITDVWDTDGNLIPEKMQSRFNGDERHSACYYAWCYFQGFYSKGIIPDYIKLLSEYDVFYRNDKERWETNVLPFQYGMRIENTNPSNDEGYKIWQQLFDDYFDSETFILNKRIDGNAILAYQRQMDKRTFDASSYVIIFCGHKTLCTNALGLSSASYETPGYDDYDLYLSYFNFKNIHWKISLRSNKVNCSEIAKKFGGGGHSGAAGFQVDDINSILKGDA